MNTGDSNIPLPGKPSRRRDPWSLDADDAPGRDKKRSNCCKSKKCRSSVSVQTDNKNKNQNKKKKYWLARREKHAFPCFFCGQQFPAQTTHTDIADSRRPPGQPSLTACRITRGHNSRCHAVSTAACGDDQRFASPGQILVVNRMQKAAPAFSRARPESSTALRISQKPGPSNTWRPHV